MFFTVFVDKNFGCKDTIFFYITLQYKFFEGVKGSEKGVKGSERTNAQEVPGERGKVRPHAFMGGDKKLERLHVDLAVPVLAHAAP